MSRDIPIGHKTSGWQSQGLSSLNTAPMPWLAHSGAKGEFSSPAGAPGPLFTRDLGYGEREQDGKALSRFTPCREAQE